MRADNQSALLRNKRLVKRTVENTSTALFVPNLSTGEHFSFSALAANLTISNPVGNPREGDQITFRIKDNGTSRTITWGSQFRNATITSTAVGKTHYSVFVFNSSLSKWDGIINSSII